MGGTLTGTDYSVEPLPEAQALRVSSIPLLTSVLTRTSRQQKSLLPEALQLHWSTAAWLLSLQQLTLYPLQQIVLQYLYCLKQSFTAA